MRDTLSRQDLTATQKILCILANEGRPVSVAEIKKLAVANGWRVKRSFNPSSLLAASAGKAAKMPDGWELTQAGRTWLESKGLAKQHAVLTPLAQKLTKDLGRITDAAKREFLRQAIDCLKNKNYRAAIVLSWVGAVAILYDHVVAKHLGLFNAEAMSRNLMKKPATSVDDLSLIKESAFLDVIHNLSIITKSEKKALGFCLDRRNTAGHPNSYTVREASVAEHIETLIHDVFDKF